MKHMPQNPSDAQMYFKNSGVSVSLREAEGRLV